MPVLGLGVPRRRPFCQPQLRSTTTGFPLLTGQPIPQGVNQVIVCKLVALPARRGLLISARGTFWVGRRDQTKLRIKNPQ